ncbi:MAG: Asp-tRNA(Asn)/Glu-tRNA(Gln) amidotransferase subunit GatC [Candidatus Omnitrophica bacterium]|jgi:aspartyl-tRNA(Asn)/glutamyl-tRNA(Gln) amidotransferase subunit C|nr:Asp-tRNA(Asn)/Glu-tRNA(Gln) amidotransferase subunit GatC [Candidatus Omnitrophota bacterium]
MKIKRDDIKYVARLARIFLTSEEEELFSGQLNNVFSYMEKLGQCQTEGVKPCGHIVSNTNVLRDDNPGQSLSVEQALANAPKRNKGFFEVPRIIESNE